MNTRRNTIFWTLAFSALGYLDILAVRFFGGGWTSATLACVCAVFVAIGIKRITKIAL
jgi:hypothetical protein